MRPFLHGTHDMCHGDETEHQAGSYEIGLHVVFIYGTAPPRLFEVDDARQATTPATPVEGIALPI
jgi:hypothetical protein